MGGSVEAGARTYEDLLSATDKEFGRKVYDSLRVRFCLPRDHPERIVVDVQLALTYHTEMEAMMPREEIGQFHSQISQALKTADTEYGFEIMGSYRRGEMLSSDIDVVVWHPYVNPFTFC